MSRESERSPSKQSRYLEAVERCISENSEVYQVSGIAAGTLFDITNGNIYRNRSDKFIKELLDNTLNANQTAIRITKPSHSSVGVTGSYYNHIQESQLMIQIDIMTRKGDDLANDISRILEALFFDAVYKIIEGVSYYIDVDRIEVQDAYEDSNLEASHSVLTVYGHYRDNLAS
jgi:hypothetical protein